MAERAIHGQYVLDAGALIAHERRDPKVAALMKVAAEHRIEMILSRLDAAIEVIRI